MGDQALGVAQIVADAHELERVLETERRRFAALDLEGHQRRARAHLPERDRGLGMIGAARIDEARDLGMLGERHRDGRRRVGLPLHPDRERLQSLEQHPGVERRDRGPGLAQQHMDVLLDEVLGGQDDAAETAALAVDMLGRRIDHAVGAELERPLPERGRKHVVDDQRGARRMRDLGDLRDVDHFQRGIGRAFEEEGLGVRPHRIAPLLEVGAFHQRRGDAVARQVVLDHVAAGAEQGLGGHDMVAGAQLPHQGGGDGRHAGCGRARGLRAFERAHARLEHRHRRVREARILVAGLLALEPLFGAGGGLVDVALGEEQRLRGLAELRAQRAGMDEAGFEAVRLGCGRGHQGLLCPTKNPAGETPPGAHASPAF